MGSNPTATATHEISSEVLDGWIHESGSTRCDFGARALVREVEGQIGEEPVALTIVLTGAESLAVLLAILPRADIPRGRLRVVGAALAARSLV